MCIPLRLDCKEDTYSKSTKHLSASFHMWDRTFCSKCIVPWENACLHEVVRDTLVSSCSTYWLLTTCKGWVWEVCVQQTLGRLFVSWMPSIWSVNKLSYWPGLASHLKCKSKRLVLNFVIFEVQSNYDGSNIFGTTENCSRHGWFEALRVNYDAKSGSKWR